MYTYCTLCGWIKGMHRMEQAGDVVNNTQVVPWLALSQHFQDISTLQFQINFQ